MSTGINQLIKIISLACSVAVVSACKTARSGSTVADASAYPYCPSNVADEDHDGWAYDHDHSCRMAPVCPPGTAEKDQTGWGWANQSSCRIAPVCQTTTSGQWGWEDNQSCQVANAASAAGSVAQAPPASGLILFETTYYPVGTESYFKTVCGDAQEHGGIYFATTEQSPLWHGECDNDSWAACADSDCLSRFDRMPSDVKRWTNGNREVREPRCNIPCNQKFRVYSQDKKYSAVAYLFDVCPSHHWNNRFKEYTEGKNPCAKGAVHVDLRKPLYLQLNGSQVTDNIHIWVDPTPVP